MTPEEKAKADEYDEAVVRLKSARNSLQKEILGELSRLDQNPDALLIKNKIDEAIEILGRNDLTGKEVNQVYDALTFLYNLDIGDGETIDDLVHRWDILYPTKIEIEINNKFAIEQMRKLM